MIQKQISIIKISIIIILLLYSSLCNAEDNLSFMIDHEAMYMFEKFVRKLALEHNIESNIQFLDHDQYSISNLNTYDGILTFNSDIIEDFSNNAEYKIIKFPFTDYIALCGANNLQSLIKEIKPEELSDFIAQNFIVILNKKYYAMLDQEIINKFDMQLVNNNHQTNSLMINGQTFGINNSYECNNHPLLFEVEKLNKTITFYLIIKKKYQNILDISI